MIFAGSLALLFLVLGVVGAIAIFAQAQQRHRAESAARITSHAAELEASLLAREAALAAAAAAFEPLNGLAQGSLSRLELRGLEFPGRQSLVWVPIVRERDVRAARVLVDAARPGQPAFLGAGRTPVGNPSAPFVMVGEILPRSAENLTSVGLLLDQLPAPHAALVAARRTRRASATAPLELVQRPNEPSVVLYAPVYLGRDSELAGYLGFSSRYSPLLEAGSKTAPFPYRVVDTEAPDRVLFASERRSTGAEEVVRQVQFAGRRLAVTYYVSPSSGRVATDTAAAYAVFILLGGGLVVVLLQRLLSLQQRLETALGAAEKAESHSSLLAAELSHRVRNIIAMISAILRKSFDEGVDGPVLRTTVEGRLAALSRATTLLVDAHWQQIPANDLFEAVLTTPRDQISISAPTTMVTAQAAQYLSLLLHELCTNSVKHGALATPTGSVQVELVIDDRHFEVRWVDHGGKPASPPERSGFGHQLLSGIIPAFFGGVAAMHYGQEGFRFRMEGLSDRLTAQ